MSTSPPCKITMALFSQRFVYDYIRSQGEDPAMVRSDRHQIRAHTKMKGLLRGLRYISQIFEANEKEQEMQIGHPTDVKHVAHIGWDGPTVNPPSWMNEFRTDEVRSSLQTEDLEDVTTPPRFTHRDLNNQIDGMALDSPELPLPKASRRNRLMPESKSVPESPIQPILLDTPVGRREKFLPLPIPRPSRGRQAAAARAASADSALPEGSLTVVVVPVVSTRRIMMSNDVSPEMVSPPPRQGRRKSKTKETGVEGSPPPPRIPKNSRVRKGSRGSPSPSSSSTSKALSGGVNDKSCGTTITRTTVDSNKTAKDKNLYTNTSPVAVL